MKNFKSYLKEIETPQFEELYQKASQKYYNKSDTIYFEDESGRVEMDVDVTLSNSNIEEFNLHAFTTGSIAAFHGTIIEGKFIADKVLMLNHK